jgi:hypothetical protein
MPRLEDIIADETFGRRDPLVEATTRFMNYHGDQKRTPLAKGMSQRDYLSEDCRSEDESARPVNLIREQSTNYGSFGDAGFDGLLVEAQKHSRALALVAQLEETRSAVEYLENASIERQLDEADGYATNRNSLRPGGGYGQSVQPVDTHGYDYSIDHQPYGGDDNSSLFDAAQAERIAKLVAMRREAERSNNVDNRNYGGGNFAAMASRLQPSPAELGKGAVYGQQNTGPAAGQHDEPYKAGNAYEANRSLVGWLTKHLPSSGGRNDNPADAYGSGFAGDGVHQGYDAPELETTSRHDREFFNASHALPFKDDAEAENDRAFGAGKSAATRGSLNYQRRIRRGASDGRTAPEDQFHGMYYDVPGISS